MTSAPAINPIVTPDCDEEDASATTRLGVDDGVETAPSVLDARGDGFAEDVGVGDTGTTVGLAAAVAVGFGVVCVGAGEARCVGVGVEDGVEPVTVIVPVMYMWMEHM